MKKILFFALLMIPLAAFSQNPKWSGTSKIPVSVTDTIIWADKFNNAPFSFDVEYYGLNHAVMFAIVVSNRLDGSYSYYKFPGIVFPILLDPVGDAYTYPVGINHATQIFKGKDILYNRFGILIHKVQPTIGNVNWLLKQ
jgi:hypothetical protein